jgi:hypothetical protein
MDASESKPSLTEKWKKRSKAAATPSSESLELDEAPVPEVSAEPVERARIDVESLIPPIQSVSSNVDPAFAEDELQMGKELAAILKDRGVYPVFIFGSKGSGKTSLIASLFKYMRDRQEADATIELVEDLFPESDPRWERRVHWSRDIFYKKVFAYIDRVAPPSTQEDLPFFIPVKISTKNSGDAYFAFLEGKGEWYQPDFSADVPFKKFKGFVQGVLQAFNGAAAVVYVAPYVTESAEEGASDKRIKDSDLGLLGVIGEYTSSRKALFHQDHHLFLMTKWDVYCHSIATDQFSDPDGEEIQRVFADRYQLSWTKYVNLSISDHMANKSYSTYCAGVMDGATIVKPAAEDEARVSFFPRKLWDTLFQGATGKVLYQDVQPRPLSLVERLLRLLRG